MGVTYYGYTYVGVQVTEADLVETITETQTIVNCDHPEAEGQKFCPVCGCAVKNRVVEGTVTSKRLRKEVWNLVSERDQGVLSDFGGEPHLNWFNEYEGVMINGYHLYQAQTDNEDRDAPYILGEQVAKTGSGGRGNGPRVMTKAADVAWTIRDIEQTAAKLGLGQRPVQHITLLYCSF